MRSIQECCSVFSGLLQDKNVYFYTHETILYISMMYLVWNEFSYSIRIVCEELCGKGLRDRGTDLM